MLSKARFWCPWQSLPPLGGAVGIDSSSLRDSARFRDLGAATGIRNRRLPCNDWGGQRTSLHAPIAADLPGSWQLEPAGVTTSHHQRRLAAAVRSTSERRACL